MKPIVGVMPLWDDKKDSLWMLPGYLDGIRQAGATAIIFPFTSDTQEIRQLTDLCSGILFTGGHDVCPQEYHETPLEGLISSCEKRDIMERIVLEMAIADDKSVLGICRGLQFINVVLGGTLFQDLPSQYPSGIVHRQPAPYNIPSHSVTIKEGSPLHKCLGEVDIQVNSCHHQAVRKLSPELSVMAEAQDGIIEAIYRPESRFLWAVQWHPEFSFQNDSNSRLIFRAFVESMT